MTFNKKYSGHNQNAWEYYGHFLLKCSKLGTDDLEQFFNYGRFEYIFIEEKRDEASNPDPLHVKNKKKRKNYSTSIGNLVIRTRSKTRNVTDRFCETCTSM